jgi:hypothetical protein
MLILPSASTKIKKTKEPKGPIFYDTKLKVEV